MKRVGCLFEKITDLENLYLAFYKAAKGKAGTKGVLQFQKNLSVNLLVLQKKLVNKDLKFGNYHYFTIYDPKIRKICAAPFPERVLHHAIMNICHDSFEKKQIYSSCACRKSKGTYFALDLAKVYNKKYKFFLKLDVRKYFDSIDHAVLKSLLRKMFKDCYLLELLDNIIDTYSVSEKKGLPIGNLTSQYFANHYLAEADHYIKENLKIPAYVRYMDDMVLWHNDKDILNKMGKKLSSFLINKYKLILKPFCLNHNYKGLPFLGYLLYPEMVALTGRSRKRFIQKVDLYEKNLNIEKWTQKEYQNHILPLISYTEYASAKKFRQKVIYGN